MEGRVQSDGFGRRTGARGSPWKYGTVFWLGRDGRLYRKQLTAECDRARRDQERVNVGEEGFEGGKAK